MNKRKNINLIVALLTVASILCMCAGCGASDEIIFGDIDVETAGQVYRSSLVTSLAAEAEGYFPSKLVDIQNGGSVPSGSESKKSITESEINHLSLLGEWELESGQDDLTGITMPYVAENDMGSQNSDIEVFPRSLTFGEWFYPEIDHYFPITNTGMLASIGGNNIGDTYRMGNQLYNTDSSASSNIGKALFNQGIMGLGKGYYSNPQKMFGYSLIDDTLAIGLLAIDGESSMIMTLDAEPIPDNYNETNIFEIDYKVEFNGYRLKLTKDGKTATYIPRIFDPNSEYGYDCGLMFQDKSIDNIKSIKIGKDKSLVMYSIRDGQQEINCSYQGDDKVIIDGKEYKYYRSQKVLTLCADGNTAYYSPDVRINPSPKRWARPSLYIAGTPFELERKTPLVNLLNRGVKTTENLDKPIRSHASSDELDFEYGGTHFGITVTNIKDHEVTLRECYISGFRIYEDSDSLAFDGDMLHSAGCRIGENVFDEVYYFYDEPYELKPDQIAYKASGAAKIEMISLGIYADDYDGPELEAKNEFDVIFSFDASQRLSQIEVKQPSLLYCGLDGNMSIADVNGLSSEQVTTLVEKRDTILDQLKDAFESAGVSAEIDENSGEIRMNSNILFAVNSSDVSSEGKSYIDDFIAAYASVILSNENSDFITSVEFEGHTDTSGGYDYNMVLSQKRAEAVMDYCINGAGLDSEVKNVLANKSNATGYGYTNPIFDDNGNINKDESRRVSIKFYIKVN